MEPTWWNGIGFAKDMIHILCKRKKTSTPTARPSASRGAVHDPATRVDLPTTDRLYRRARELTGVDRVGLSLGPASNATMLGLVGHLLMSSPNLKTVLEGLGHYYACLPTPLSTVRSKKARTYSTRWNPCRSGRNTTPFRAGR
jgi:hypothetical protein